MNDIVIKEISSEQELKAVLELCCNVLGETDCELYGYDAWLERLKNRLQPLVYAVKDEKIVSAVLGRAENNDSLVIGFVACHEDYRRQGNHKELNRLF